jgi:hypothetical protein
VQKQKTVLLLQELFTFQIINMKCFVALLLVSLGLASTADAQKITTLQHEGKKIQVLDMTPGGRVTWGGYEEIGDAVRSESDGSINTAVIIKVIGKNAGQEGKPYAAAICDSSTAGGFTDWYLPAKDESDIVHAHFQELKLDEKMTLWTSTEANGTQAVTKYLYTGAFYNSQKVDQNHFVCIRKVK